MAIGREERAEHVDEPQPPLATPDGEPASVVHVAAELAPFARSGGLGEAVAALARYQCAAGIPVAVVMPLYGAVRASSRGIAPVGEPFTVQLGDHRVGVRLYRSTERSADLPQVYFVENAHAFDRAGMYGVGGHDYPDNAYRFALFCRAVVEALPRIAPTPTVVVHAHDWHGALVPVYLRLTGAQRLPLRRVRSVLTVHNAGYQGVFPASTMPEIGLPWELFDWRRLEWHGQLNCLKGGLVFSDMVTTVSPTHAHELRTGAGGFGLHGVFVWLRDRFVGIVNGIDQRQWSPERDPDIPYRFTRDDLRNKRRCRWALQHGFGLERRAHVPIFALTARLVSQKGLDLILGDPGYFALDAQYIFLGSGEPRYEQALSNIAARAPSRIAVEFEFSEPLEHALLAGADLCLMPSLYEPCGLTQMRAQRYGTIPVARRVGGLADTIEDGVTGFLFDDYTPSAFMDAVVRALDHYRDREAWRAMMREAMARDFGWERSEQRYRDVYRRALARHEA
ncbi:MAG TPA: glycogen synthase [Gemmatimonadaceae bacterium]|nr:glycogen synthase [Gemmatimonadaceae bacterium]